MGEGSQRLLVVIRETSSRDVMTGIDNTVLCIQKLPNQP